MTQQRAVLSLRRLLRAAMLAGVLEIALAGCATHPMMPTPALYTGTNARPLFTAVPVDERRPPLDLLYITDREAILDGDGLLYTAERSRSMAFGSALIDFGDNVGWDEL